MVLNAFAQSFSNHRERTDSRRGLNTDETRLKNPLEGEGGECLLSPESLPNR